MQIRKYKLTSTFWGFFTDELVRNWWREKYELLTVIERGGCELQETSKANSSFMDFATWL